VQEIREILKRLEAGQEALKADIGTLKAGQAELSRDVQTLKAGQAELSRELVVYPSIFFIWRSLKLRKSELFVRDAEVVLAR